MNELFVALGLRRPGRWCRGCPSSEAYNAGAGSAASSDASAAGSGTTLGGNNPNGSATYLGMGGFRLPFQVTGFLVLGNMVWLAGTRVPRRGHQARVAGRALDEEFESVEARAAELSADRAERGEGVPMGVPSRSDDATAAAGGTPGRKSRRRTR